MEISEIFPPELKVDSQKETWTLEIGMSIAVPSDMMERYLIEKQELNSLKKGWDKFLCTKTALHRHPNSTADIITVE